MKYFKKLIADRIYLSPMNSEDAETYANWLNDIRVCGPIGRSSVPMSIQAEKAFIDNACKSGYNFAVVLKENDQLIGNASLMDVDGTHKTAEIGLFIGEETYRGMGIGGEILNLLLSYGFLTLNLNNIMLKVFSFNTRGIKAYQKVGFKEIGRRRQANYFNGQYHDVIYMDIIKDEYTCQYPNNFSIY